MAKETDPVALSIKQPWAALVVAGLKTIEIRRWPTARHGRVLIHAARIPDKRPEATKVIPESLAALTQMRGGIIGAVELLRCVAYRDLESFRADQPLHYNEPAWFEEPALYGFVFSKPEILPFRSYSGWVRFFKVEGVTST